MPGQRLEQLEPDALPAPAVEALEIVVYGPYSAGQSRQRAPILSMCTMPEITRRSSTRCAPLRPFGSNGSIRAHSASLNQVSCLAINASAPSRSLESAIHNQRSLIEYGP